MESIGKDEPGEIEVEIKQEEAPAAPEIEVEVDGELAAEATSTTDSAISQLRAQLEAEKQARLHAEQRAKAAQDENYRSQTEVSEVQLHLVTTALATAQQNAEVLAERMAEALANGDHRSVAELNREMAANEHKIQLLADGKKKMEEAPKPRPAPADPVEALASQLTPRSAAWVRSHPEYARDQRMFNQMVAAHNMAVARGIEPDTDEYFDRVETLLDIKTSNPIATDVDNPLSEAAAPTQRRSSPPVAPVSRQPVGSQPKTPNRLRLTAEEHEMARNMKMSPEEYATQKLRIQRDNAKNKRIH